MRWWKIIGLAGVAGVAATGAVIARDERKRNSYSADEVRSRLHDRAADALLEEQAASDAPAQADPGPVVP